MKLRTLPLLALALVFAACGSLPPAGTPTETPAPTASPTATPAPDYPALAAPLLAQQAAVCPVDEPFLRWCEENGATGLSQALYARLAANEGYTDDWYYAACGQSLRALYARYAETADPNLHILGTAAPGEPVALDFTGDVNFAESWYIMQHMTAAGESFEDCFGPALLAELRGADILLCNNEFCLSDGGSPMPGKKFTFRASTGQVANWDVLGADLVGLANNHCADYGPQAFLDTLDTLQAAGLPYVGAGRNLAEAQQAQYFVVGGLKIGYVAATRAEKNIMTPGATADSPGVLRTYDPADTLAAITAARANSDFVVVYLHWGTEESTLLEAAQRELASQYADAGADFIVGAHPHILQGCGWRGDVPVVYSLGNFWFNMETQDTAVARITLHGPARADATVQLLPGQQSGGHTILWEDAENQHRVWQHLNAIMENGYLDEEGFLRQSA